MAISAERNIKAQRGGDLRCKGWRQEAILRMLENNLENRRAARGADRLRGLGQGGARLGELRPHRRGAQGRWSEDQTLVVQSGKPVGLFHTHRLSPIAVIANGNIVGRWATMAGWQELIDAGLSMFGGHDGGRLAVHRLAGHPAGHLRDVHGGRRASTSAARLAGRLVLTAGLGRHGRRPAARGRAGGRGDARRRGRPRARRAAPARGLPAAPQRRPRRGARAGARREGAGRGDLGRARREHRRRHGRAARARHHARHRHRPDDDRSDPRLHPARHDGARVPTSCARATATS